MLRVRPLVEVPGFDLSLTNQFLYQRSVFVVVSWLFFVFLLRIRANVSWASVGGFLLGEIVFCCDPGAPSPFFTNKIPGVRVVVGLRTRWFFSKTKKD
jgi:hypothetical protein